MFWKKEELGKICNTSSGGTPSRKYPEYYENGEIPWVKSGELENNTIISTEECISRDGLENSNAKIFPPGTLLIALYGATIGKLAFLGIEAATNQAVCGIFENEKVTLKYLYYFLLFNRPNLIKKGMGGAQSNISQTILKQLLVPYPVSMNAQMDIVSRIEELFSKLDKGVEMLQTIKRQLAVYRQAVLKEAFEGKLTERWRQNIENYPLIVKMDLEKIEIKSRAIRDTSGDENEAELFLPSAWKKVRIGNLFEVEVGATPSRKKFEYWNGNINWVSSGEITFNNIFHTKEQITEDGLYSSSTNIQPIGTVMLAMIGEGKTRGRAAILQVEAAHNQNTAAILVSKTSCQPKYLYYFLQMNYENTRRIGSGNNQKALNKERVRAMRFPFTSFAEQSQIIQEIESRLSVCDSIEQTVTEALIQADAMRQSILKQAFEGKL